MAVTLKGQTAVYEGTSTDTKPTDADNNAIFKELDTGIRYYYDGTNWNEIPSSGGGGGGGTGTDNYNELNNKPSINGTTLSGNKSLDNLGIQAKLTFDSAPTEDSENPVKSGGVYSALAGKQDTISDLSTIRSGAAAGASAVQPAAMEAALAQKQDALSSEQLDAVNSGVTSADVEQITTNKNNILSIDTELSAEYFGNRVIDQGKRISCYTNYIVYSNCQTVRIADTIISERAIQVVPVNKGTSWIRFNIDPISFDEMESITILCKIPDEVQATDKTMSGYFNVGVSENGNSPAESWDCHSNGCSITGWQYLTFTKDKFVKGNNTCPTINYVWIKFTSRASVAASGTYGPFIFDSIITNLKVKPTILISFDQIWQESIDNDGYAIMYNRFVPFTIFDGEVGHLEGDILAEAYNMIAHGCEIQPYGGYTLAASVVYSDAKTLVETLKGNLLTQFNPPNAHFACKQHSCKPALKAALRDSNYKIIRYQDSDCPITAFGKQSWYIPAKEIPAGSTSSALIALVDRAINYHCVQPIFTHGICNDGHDHMSKDGEITGSSAIAKSEWLAFLNYVKMQVDANKLDVMTYDGFYTSCIGG